MRYEWPIAVGLVRDTGRRRISHKFSFAKRHVNYANYYPCVDPVAGTCEGIQG